MTLNRHLGKNLGNNKKLMLSRIDPDKIKLSGGKLISVLDHNVPEYILSLLDKHINNMIDNYEPDANFDNNPIISYTHQKESMYRRWNMQIAPEYVEWRIPEFKNLESYLLQWASNIYNFKFIFSSPKTEIVWHEVHKTPRIHIPLQIKDTTFEILDENEELHSIQMHRGKMYMFNVCYPHRIKVFGDVQRKLAFFECDYIKKVE